MILIKTFLSFKKNHYYYFLFLRFCFL